MMPHQTTSASCLDLGLSLGGGLTSQGSLSSSTTTAASSSPWAAALSSVVADRARWDTRAHYHHHHAASAAVPLDLDPDYPALAAADRAATARASTSPDSAAALSSGASGDNTPTPTAKREREAAELERTGSGCFAVRSDEEDGGCADGGGRNKKLRLSKDQAAVLEECFKTHSTLNPKQKVALANRLGLRPRQVEVWFQNRRARTKLKQTEVDCEYLKRWCERLADENKRLEKELADLRALKAAAAPPPSPASATAQQPAATLTMCPSCRRVATTTTPPAASRRHHHQQCHPKPSPILPPAAAAGGGSHCQFFPAAAVDRTPTKSAWNAAAPPLVTRELF